MSVSHGHVPHTWRLKTHTCGLLGLEPERGNQGVGRVGSSWGFRGRICHTRLCWKPWAILRGPLAPTRPPCSPDLPPLYSGSRVQRELPVSNPICKHPVSKLGSWGQDQNTGILRRHSSTHEGSRNTYIPQVDPRKPATTIRAMPARVPAASAGLVHLGGRPGPSPSGTVPVPASHGLLLTDTPWCRVVWGRTAVIALSR